MIGIDPYENLNPRGANRAVEFANGTIEFGADMRKLGTSGRVTGLACQVYAASSFQ
jgi:hypothetical protein